MQVSQFARWGCFGCKAKKTNNRGQIGFISSFQGHPGGNGTDLWGLKGANKGVGAQTFNGRRLRVLDITISTHPNNTTHTDNKQQSYRRTEWTPCISKADQAMIISCSGPHSAPCSLNTQLLYALSLAAAAAGYYDILQGVR